MGSFVVKTKTTQVVANRLLIELNFEQCKVWKYHPHHIISLRRVEFGASTYLREIYLDLERLRNKESWGWI